MSSPRPLRASNPQPDAITTDWSKKGTDEHPKSQPPGRVSWPHGNANDKKIIIITNENVSPYKL